MASPETRSPRKDRSTPLSGGGCRALVFALVAGIGLSGCAPNLIPPSPTRIRPHLTGDWYRTADGRELPMQVWPASTSPEAGEPTKMAGDNPEKPAAVIIGLHGMNDHAGAFQTMAEDWNKAGISVYAYDQRGFGAAPWRGRWGGSDAMIRDARDFARLIREKHPDSPLYYLGLSMGGAVALNALESGPDSGSDSKQAEDARQAAEEAYLPPVDGAILVAPAVWGRDFMPFYQTGALWIMAHSLPWLTLTGKGMKIVPSDNYDMLKAMSEDPKVLHETRIDAIWGIVNLMDLAVASAPRQTKPLLLMYGLKDDIIPKAPTIRTLETLPRLDGSFQRVALYEDGYHMLLRDLLAVVPRRDVAAWVRDPLAPLPSGADRKDWQALMGKDVDIDYPTRADINARKEKARQISGQEDSSQAANPTAETAQ